MDAPTLTLYSSDLLSKWGFNDGDMPDELWDYGHENEIRCPDGPTWRAALCVLVRDHLLPALTENYGEIDVISFVTNHNPIRAVVIEVGTLPIAGAVAAMSPS